MLQKNTISDLRYGMHIIKLDLQKDKFYVQSFFFKFPADSWLRDYTGALIFETCLIEHPFYSNKIYLG